MRARIALSASAALGLPQEDAIACAACSELLHNASLIHDDLQDGDEVRRDRPAVWAAFGRDVAVCVGDAMVSAAYAALGQVRDVAVLPALLRVVHAAVARTVRGQCADLAARDAPVDALVDYDTVAAGKSGPLLALPLQLPLTLAGAPIAARAADMAVRHFAIGYQMADDLEDRERDARSTDGGASLNAIAVAAVESPGQDPVSIVAARAAFHLSTAMRLADDLPGGCGALLVEEARGLERRVRAHAAD